MSVAVASDPSRASGAACSALFLLCMALGGAIGDPMNGALFDLVATYRPLFLMMAVYTALAFAAVLAIPRGRGDAATAQLARSVETPDIPLSMAPTPYRRADT